MDFDQSPAQRARYAGTVAALRELPAGAGFDRERWQRLGALGLLGACVPQDQGGQGLGALDTALQFEAAGYACPDVGLLFAAGAHLFACAMPIAHFGAADLRARVLPGMCAGELIAGNCMTEDGAGSDISRLSTTATAVPGGYRLNGAKAFVTNGPVADLHLVYATTDPQASQWGITAFLVPAGTEGVRVGEPLDKLGMTGAAASTVGFEDCFVDEATVLGAPGQGTEIFQHSMSWERACLFALFLGVQDRLIERSAEHARDRRQFGRRLTDFQAVSHRLAEAKLRVESARLLLYRACWSIDAGRPSALFTALSKLATSEAMLATATDAVRLFGWRGYLAGHEVSAALGDAIGGTLFSGTSDIQRQLIALELLAQLNR
ncbi:acyl-CoA dehydrogenase family protein [Crossiella sp. CA198]|uniref:acyl-CoA dehydrogenase family protein n=1 Tax=Crossiella sp. CA198 TaxID=3455607 RepID=UPI003F8D2060